MGLIESIHVAPTAGAPLVAVEAATLDVGRGIVGDRYHAGVGAFSRWPGEGRAVSLIEAEAVEAILAETGIDLAGGRSRRNVVTRGVRLLDLIGRTFAVGGAVLRGTRECTACGRMDRLVAPGAFAAMKGRGGLRADVVAGGVVAVGDGLFPLPLRGRDRRAASG